MIQARGLGVFWLIALQKIQLYTDDYRNCLYL